MGRLYAQRRVLEMQGSLSIVISRRHQGLHKAANLRNNTPYHQTGRSSSPSSQPERSHLSKSKISAPGPTVRIIPEDIPWENAFFSSSKSAKEAERLFEPSNSAISLRKPRVLATFSEHSDFPSSLTSGPCTEANAASITETNSSQFRSLKCTSDKIKRNT